MIKDYSLTNEDLNKYIDEKYVVLVSVENGAYAEAIFYTNNRNEAIEFTKTITFDDAKEFKIAKGKRCFYVSAGLNPDHPKFTKGDEYLHLVPTIKISKEKSEIDGTNWYKTF